MTAEKKTITYKIDKSVNCLYSLCADIKATVYLIIFNYVLYTIRMKRFRTCSDDNSIAVSIQLQKSKKMSRKPDRRNIILVETSRKTTRHMIPNPSPARTYSLRWTVQSLKSSFPISMAGSPILPNLVALYVKRCERAKNRQKVGHFAVVKVRGPGWLSPLLKFEPHCPLGARGARGLPCRNFHTWIVWAP